MLSSIIEFIASFFRALFGKSTETKLGIAENTIANQKNTLNNVKVANDVQDKIAASSDADVDRVLRNKWQRD